MASYLRSLGYTHKGWFGVCPVYLGPTEDEGLVKISPRWEVVIPLFVISQWYQQGYIYFISWLNPQWIPCWHFKVTGELDD